MSHQERREQWLGAALKMSQLLLGDVDPQEALRIVIAELRTVSGAEGAAIVLADSTYPEGRGVFAAVEGLGLEPLRGTTVPLQGLAASVLSSGRAIVSADMTFEDDPAPAVAEGQASLGLGMYIPLVAAGDVLGLLVAGWRRGSVHERIAAAETDLVEMFADHAALAVRQAHARRRIWADRERIADGLREQAIGRIFALGTRLHSVLGRADREHGDVRRKLYDAVGELDGTNRQIRSAVFALDPAWSSGQKVLTDRLLDEIDAARGVLGFTPRLAIRGILDNALPPHLEDGLLRGVREALTNAASRTGLSEVEVEVGVTQDELVLTVIDDGRPADRSATSTEAPPENRSSMRVTLPLRPGSTVCTSIPTDEELR
ncbi:GAF domain-containing sensor histidine kinase [Actinopolymorpha pittospori]|uniref:Signal transduction histidine kinase n=1 Tax=Actinopolymorpha pittospori TaxID=648752 RepID=A0A927MZH3_9ACTN|nr:GAF domain-containing protein [Actinopolymorpha pittospori]MBE1609194.1 signal transduction histidine kinase [Actinopolymorpha pittospori]